MNDGTFQVGEIAVFRNLVLPFAHMNGEECEIVGTLAPRLLVDIRGDIFSDQCYTVAYHGDEVAVQTDHLKKKPKPAFVKDAEFGKKVEWDKCAWNPKVAA